jgi:hypothetical protein
MISRKQALMRHQLLAWTLLLLLNGPFLDNLAYFCPHLLIVQATTDMQQVADSPHTEHVVQNFVANQIVESASLSRRRKLLKVH